MVICLLFYSYFLKQSTHSLLNYQLRNSENNYENVLGVIYFQYLMHEIENVLANERIKQITEETSCPYYNVKLS